MAKRRRTSSRTKARRKPAARARGAPKWRRDWDKTWKGIVKKTSRTRAAAVRREERNPLDFWVHFDRVGKKYRAKSCMRKGAKDMPPFCGEARNAQPLTAVEQSLHALHKTLMKVNFAIPR